MSQNNMTRIAIVAGGRTPFVKAGKAFKDLGPLKLGSHAVSNLIEKYDIDPAAIEALAYGVTLPEPGKPNLARELVFEVGLPKSIEAQTISSYPHMPRTLRLLGFHACSDADNAPTLPEPTR